MKKILLLLFFIIYLCSCQTSLDLYDIDFPGDSTIANTAFWIDGSDDPLGISAVVAQKLSDYGLKAVAVSDREMFGLISSSTGTAFAVSSNMLVTNSHVVGSADTVTVIIGTDEIEADVVHNEPDVDLAIIKVPVELPYSFKLSDDVEKGLHVTVMGYPYTEIMGRECKITEGIVSSETGAYDTILKFQFSAPIQPGNSGGPVFNDDYSVIGVATEKVSDIHAFSEDGFIPQNANYAVNGCLLQFVAENFIFDKDSSSVVDSLEDAEKAVFMVKSEERTDINNDILIKISYTYDFNTANTAYSRTTYFVNPILFTLYTMDGIKIGEIEESSYAGSSYIRESAYETAEYVALHIFYAYADIAMPCTNSGEKIY